MTISLRRTLVLGLTLALPACGGEGLTLPPDGEPAHIEIILGNGQSGRVGSALADSLVVVVTDTRDRPVANANVVFDFTADGSAASPATASTDADGRAASRLVLGTRVGPVAGKVGVPVDAGVTPVQAAITATATSSDANGIALVSGDTQSATVGTPLSDPLVVAVTDAFHNPIKGVTITWSVGAGGGSVSSATTVTGDNGEASVTRTLGNTAGEWTTQATATGLAGSPVTFTHTATAGTATGVVKISGDNQSGSPGSELAQPLVVEVLDAGGNPIPGRAVTWVIGAGGGGVAPENTTTDDQGHASTRWTLGPAIGGNTVNAVVSGVGTATFSASATAGSPSAANSQVSAGPGTITAGTGTSTITVTVRDAGNNPVTGASVTVAASGTGNTINPATASSGGNGVATFSFSSTVAEAKTITATAGGVAITDQATITVQKASSTVDITSDEPDGSVAGQSVTVEFTVSGNGGTPTGDVVITISNGLPTETCTGTLSNGSGSCVLPVTLPGTGAGNRRVLTATYNGDAQFSGDTDTENHRVDPLPSSNNPPTAAFNEPSCTVGQSCQFTDGSTDSDGSIQNQSWEFQDGSPATSTDANPGVIFGSSGSKTVKLTVTDNDGATNSVTHQVTVAAAPNSPPTAADDAYTTTLDMGFHAPGINGPSLLANDTDSDGGTLSTTAETVGTSQGGTAVIGTDGSFDYTPLSGSTGADTFTYTVNDGQGGSDTGTATVMINP